MREKAKQQQGHSEEEVNAIIRRILDDIVAEYRQEQKLKKSMKREARLSVSKKCI